MPWERLAASFCNDLLGLRHSLSDRLRAIVCPPDFIDNLDEWTTVGIGRPYGTVYSLDA